MGYRINLGLRGNLFFVPAEVVDEGLRFCGAAQLKTLLLVLRENCGSADPALLAEKLGLPEGDVLDALDYWAGRGILERDGEPSPALQNAPSAPHGVASQTAPPPADAPEPSPPAAARPEPIRKKPTMAEVEQYQKSDPCAAFALRQCEATLGKAFSSSDTATLVWLIEWAGVPADVLVTVAEYCRLSGRTSLRSIEKTALGWLDDGVDTLEAAEERIRVLAERQGWEGELKELLGIGGRPFSAKERAFAEEWRKLELSPALIRAAFERTLDGAGKLSFPYLNRILLDWKRKGITTPQQAAAEVRPGAEAAAPSFDVDDFSRRIMLSTPSL